MKRSPVVVPVMEQLPLSSHCKTKSSLAGSPVSPVDITKKNRKKTGCRVLHVAERSCLPVSVSDDAEFQAMDSFNTTMLKTNRKAPPDEHSFSSPLPARKRRNRLIVVSSEKEETNSRPAAVVSGNVAECEEESVLTLRDLPGEILKELFSCCDIPTRCRIRRISRFWKYLMLQPEVNEVAMMDRSCLKVSNFVHRNPRRRCRGERKRSEIELRSGLFYLDSKRTRPRVPGRYRPDKFANLEDHRRSGLLGAHVRAIVFTSDMENTSALGLFYLLRSVGLHCVNIERAIFLRVRWAEYTIKRSDFFDPDLLASFPYLRAIIIADSIMNFGSVFGPAERELVHIHSPVPSLMIKVPLEGENAHIDLGPFVFPCSLKQRDWIAKFAPKLPEEYHEWVARGSQDCQNIQKIATGEESGETYDLITADYSKMSPCVLRILSSFISLEMVHGSEVLLHRLGEYDLSQ